MVLNGFCVFKLDTMQAKIYVIKVKKYPANAETVYDATGLNINTRYTWEKLIKVAWMLIWICASTGVSREKPKGGGVLILLASCEIKNLFSLN